VKFWLLSPTHYQVLRLVILKMILRKRNNSNSKSRQKSNHRLQYVANYQPGNCLKEETQIFILLSVRKRCEKSEVLHIDKDSSPLCVDVFHRDYSSAGGTYRCILPVTLKADKPDVAADCLTLRP